ncbi:beta-1,6-N-acetylglucosaminyltransferase [Rouxiella badensis]|uniref:beta-1,6-N-acetylglucosaminyltransferase n=1 Tax=Rouxiella badensis TaxID=1646377 RepID=UPI001D145CED|nr:beta-1,6-N-acetylglucosaminyltransferase [Rouxiella badensis]MCC3719625.1 beta-1,6-N-acetylglucosaminyltransferase [Rouxiella badensis]MCC3728875.1 beta-1,6-N-acetylglucosaminyltransferase [Rouxiella badensis]MCC3740929.1 beta-1,6-N-acetylglucosaminyltransferase [Rouxiella badensis]
MKKAFLICAHRPSRALSWCVEYLSSFDENIIIIHYDKKSNINDIKELNKDNVFFTSNRVDVTWGGVSQIYATLQLLREALRYEFQYCFFISGEDVPAVSNEKINAILTEGNGANFIHYQDERNNFIDPYERCIYAYPAIFFSRKNDFISKVIKKSYKFIKPIFFKNKSFVKLMKDGYIPKLYKGTNWFSLTYETTSWLISELDNNPYYLKAFDYSLCADEVFFHSLLKTKDNLSLYHDTSKINDCLRYIDWKTGPQFPKLLNISDIESIRASDTFFCRKVDERMNDSDFAKFKDLVSR